MKKIILAVLVVLAVVSSAFAAEAKMLIAVFSRADENYSVGRITVGNTMKLAQVIAAKTGAELFEIAPAKKYPVNYDECTEAAQRELNQNARPAIAQDKDISDYDVIFLGYPIWWGDCPMCVYTFIEAHDWTGKTVIPFCTSEGSGAGRTGSTLPAALKGAQVKNVMNMRGRTAQKGGSDVDGAVDAWLKGLGLGF